jgi:protein-tyrosine phosphatase
MTGGISVIDFHSHILPEIDDGSRSLEESMAMLRMEREQGVTHVVATPHFYARHDKPEKFLARRDRAEECLRREMEKEEGLPELFVGAEVHYFPGISHSDILPQLTIRGKLCIMIEMPGVSWPESAFRELQQIYDRWGIVPIIAHIDRYIRPWYAHRIWEKLQDLPVLIQANAEFFLESKTSRKAMRMLKKDRIHLLGSDCHDLDSRKPNLGEAIAAIEKRLSSEAVARIESNGRSILNL